MCLLVFLQVFAFMYKIFERGISKLWVVGNNLQVHTHKTSLQSLGSLEPGGPSNLVTETYLQIVYMDVWSQHEGSGHRGSTALQKPGRVF